MIELRGEIMKKLTPSVLDKIRQAPKPTPVAEVVSVTKEFEGIALSLDEIAEIINIADPGRKPKAKGSDYEPKELEKYPDLLLIRTPSEILVRYSAKPRL